MRRHHTGSIEGSKQTIDIEPKPGRSRGPTEPAHQMVVSAPASQLRPDTRRKDVEDYPVIIFKPAELAQIEQHRLLPGRHQSLIDLRKAIEWSQ